MERNDLVDFPMRLSDGTSFIIRTHPGTDMDEVLGSWLIRLRATKEWIIENSQEIDGKLVIFLGVGEASQRGVFNEHVARDLGGDESNSCATLVAKSLRIMDDPILKTLITYGLTEDTKGTQSPFDVPMFLKHARSLGRDNSENIQWAHQALDIWYANAQQSSQLPEAHRLIYNQMIGSPLNIAQLSIASRLLATTGVDPEQWLNTGLEVYDDAERRTVAACIWTKAHAQPHNVNFAGNRFTYWVVESDDAFATNGVRRWGIPVPLLIRIESDGHFQIFVRGDSRLAEEVFSSLIHQLYKNVNLIPEDVLKKPTSDQIKWVRHELPLGTTPYWMWRLYFHPATGGIFNGSLTARYQEPLIGNGLSVSDLCRVIESAVLRVKPSSAKSRRKYVRPTSPTSPPAPPSPESPTATESAPTQPEPTAPTEPSPPDAPAAS